MPGKLGGACAGDTRFCSRVTPDGLLQRNSVQRCSHLIVLQKQILHHAPNHSNQARHQTQPSAISATPTTQNEDRCSKCHTYHVKRRSMLPSATPATPATQMEGRCRQVPRLPHKVPRRRGRPTATKCAARPSPVP